MTTAEKYRQLEKSPAINIARYIFSCVKSNATNSTLGDEIVEIKTGKTPSKQNKKFYEDDFLNWFKPDEIGSEKYLFEAKDKLSKLAFENNHATIYEPDTILINAIGDVGRISILKVKASSNQQITGIRLNKKIDIDYAYFYLLANRHFFYVDLFQTTLPIVNQKKINSIPIVYPDIKEQRNIVEGLVEIDKIKSVEDLIIIDKLNWNEDYKNACRNFFSVQFNSKNISTALSHQLNLVKKLRQQLLQDAVQGKLVEQNPKDKPASELLDEIKKQKDTLIKQKKLKIGRATEQSVSLIDDVEIPKSWQWCKSDEIFFVTKLAGFEYSEHISLKESGDIPVVRAQNVRPLSIDKTNLLYIDAKTSATLERCALIKKCLLVTFIGAGIGDVATFEETERWHLAPNVAKMEPFEGCEELTNVKYLNYYLMSRLGQKEIFKHVKATAQPSLSMGTIRDIDFAIPPLAEQHRIVEKLDELMQYCNELEASIKQSESQNEKLLQQVLREALRKN